MGIGISSRDLWCALALVALVAGFSGCASDEERIETHLERAAEYPPGKDKEAILELRNALQLDPKNAEINFLIAARRVNQEKWETAAFFYLEAYRLDPTRTDAALLGASLLNRTGDPERGLELIAAVIETDPANPRAYQTRAEILRSQGDFEGALQSVETLLEIEPDEVSSYISLGRVYRDHFRQQLDMGGEPPADSLFQRALDAFAKADELEPNWVSKINLARVYTDWPEHGDEAKLKYREAVQFANQRIEEDPDGHGINIGIYDEAARVAKGMDDPEFKSWAYGELVQKMPGRLDIWAEFALLREKREGKGEEVLAQLLERWPEEPKARIVVYNYHLAQGDWNRAVAALDEAIEAKLDPALMLRIKYKIQLGMGNREGALKTFKALEGDYPDSRELVLARASQDIAEGRAEEAAVVLREFVTTEENAESHLLLAEAEYARGNTPAAEAALQRSVEFEEEISRERLALELKLRFRRKDWSGALDTYHDMMDIGAPMGLMQTIGLIEALYQMDRVPTARQIMDQSLKISGGDPPASLVVQFVRWEEKEQPERARVLLDAAYEKRPTHPNLLDLKVSLDLREGDLDSAMAKVDRALKLVPDEARIHLLKGRLLLRAGKLDEASAEVERAFELDPHLPGVLDQLLAIHSRQKVFEKSILVLEKEIAAGRLDLRGRLRLAKLYYGQGNREQAGALYEEVLLAWPDSVAANREYALLLAETGGDLERALILAKKAQELSPEGPDVAHTLGFVYLQKGMYEPAAQQLQYAVELLARSGQARVAYHYHLSEALRGLGRHSEATEELERAGALLPPSFIEAQQRGAEEENSPTKPEVK